MRPVGSSFDYPSGIGLRGTRRSVLAELKRSPGTARDLALRLGISLNGIRHHLKELETAELILSERIRHGVGAPSYVYRLSSAGEDLFPRRYRQVLEQLLDFVVARDGRAAAAAALEAHFEPLLGQLHEELSHATADQKMKTVVRALSAAGYMAEGHTSFSCGTLTERNCAVREVAERFPEICAAEERFLARVFGGSVERTSHLLGGCNTCAYNVTFPQESA